MPASLSTQFHSILALDNQEKFLLTTSLDRTVNQRSLWERIKGFFGGGGYNKEGVAANVKRLFSVANQKFLLTRSSGELTRAIQKLEELRTRFTRGAHPLRNPHLFVENLAFLRGIEASLHSRSSSLSSESTSFLSSSLPASSSTLSLSSAHSEMSVEEQEEAALIKEYPSEEMYRVIPRRPYEQIRATLRPHLTSYPSYIQDEVLREMDRLYFDRENPREMSPEQAILYANYHSKKLLLNRFGKELLLSTLHEMYKHHSFLSGMPDPFTFLRGINDGSLLLDERAYRAFQVCCDKRQRDFLRFNAQGLALYRKHHSSESLLTLLGERYPEREAMQSKKLLEQGRIMFPMDIYTSCRRLERP